MAKRGDADLFQTLRSSGLRKKVARRLSEAADKTSGAKQPEVLTRTIEDLRNAASELESRITGNSRSAAAQKAARTRKRKAAARSAAARKGARSRARSGTS